MRSPSLPTALIEAWKRTAWDIVSRPNVYSDHLYDLACKVIRQHGVPQ
jgi:16S rRNA G1207 methylase RsmC